MALAPRLRITSTVALAAMAAGLAEAVDALEAATDWILANGKERLADVLAGAVKYAAGPLSVAAVFQSKLSDARKNFYSLAGSYDLGVAKLAAALGMPTPPLGGAVDDKTKKDPSPK